MKKLNALASFAMALAAFAAPLAANATTYSSKIGYLIPTASADELTRNNEIVPLEFFLENCYSINKYCGGGEVITSNDVSKISVSNYAVIWVHIDRTGLSKDESLPFSSETVAALKAYVEEGGNLYLSKQATRLISTLGRVSDNFAPDNQSCSEGDYGTDVWSLNAQVGYNCKESDPSQYYDHRDHAIYKDMVTFIAPTAYAYEWETFPLEGTGDGTAMWREDHNSTWSFDLLSGYSSTNTGANWVEKYQNETESIVIGQWGHVVDHVCAGVIEFPPTSSCKGHILANGLAAVEWAPREGTNAYHSNIEKLTLNTLNYLFENSPSYSSAQELQAASAAKIAGGRGEIRYSGVEPGAEIAAYSADGALVAAATAATAEGSLSLQAQGIVIVKIVSAQGATTKKLIIK